MLSLITEGIGKLSSGLLSALVVEYEPWINIVLEDPVFFSSFLLPNYLPVFMATVSMRQFFWAPKTYVKTDG